MTIASPNEHRSRQAGASWLRLPVTTAGEGRADLAVDGGSGGRCSFLARKQVKEALKNLPHGPEFRFVDQLRELDPGRSGTAEYRVRGEEPFLRGHFPDDPLFPGVLLVEAAAQLAGVVAQSDPAHGPLEGLKLTGIRNAKILGTARPGETIVLWATITGRLKNLVQASAGAEVNGRVVLETVITLSGENRPVS